MATRKIKWLVEMLVAGKYNLCGEIEFTLETFIEDGRESLDEWWVEQQLTPAETDAITLWANDFGNMDRICNSIGIVPHGGMRGDHLEELVGRRVVLDEMPDDPNPILPGSKGTIVSIDDIRNIHVWWDDGRALSLIPGVDKYRII